MMKLGLSSIFTCLFNFHVLYESKIRSVGTFLSTNNMKCYPRKTTMRALFVLHVLHDDRTSPAAIAWNGIRCS